MKQLVVGILMACACGGSGDDSQIGGIDAPGGGGGTIIPYQPFTAKTRSMDKGSFDQISTTDLIGPIACGLSTNASAGLGTSGSQIILNISDLNYRNCPVGTYAIRSGCELPSSGGFNTQVPFGCAYYRKYDQQGQLLGTAIATAGAIGVTGSESSCTFDVTLSFAGQTHHDTFTLTSWPMSWPWCK